MKYTTLVISDVHWGVIDPNEQELMLSFIFSLLDYIEIDLIVIAGDYWDTKLPLNSTEAFKGTYWMDTLIRKAKERNVKKFRIVKGTEDHDNSQLEIFRYLQEDDGWFKIFDKTTSEETLPGFHCLYCPDETLATEEYLDTYVNEICKPHNIGFFHGSFDVVYAERKASPLIAKNVIFEYSVFSKVINGPMLSGHWHNGKQYGDLYYIGSPFRWAFDEDEPKGVGIVSYDTTDNSYIYQKIENPIASRYETIEVYTEYITEVDQYQAVIRVIDELVEEMKDDVRKLYVRVKIYQTDDKVENESYISALRHYYMKESFVKIVLKNKLKDKRKKEELKKNQDFNQQYEFLQTKQKAPAQNIHDFILETRQVELPIEYIDGKIKKYIKEL